MTLTSLLLLPVTIVLIAVHIVGDSDLVFASTTAALSVVSLRVSPSGGPDRRVSDRDVPNRGRPNRGVASWGGHSLVSAVERNTPNHFRCG